MSAGLTHGDDLAPTVRPSSRPKHARSGDRRRSLAVAVDAIDRLLRRYYDVHEFCTDARCFLRLACEPAVHRYELGDGTTIEPGESIGVLHLCNERLPRFTVNGPDLLWGKAFERRLRLSLEELAHHAQADRGLQLVRGFRASVGFGGALGFDQMRRVAPRWGFVALKAPSRSWRQRLHDAAENALIWLMVCAFNPRALRQHRFWCRRYEVWISRKSLLNRYGSPGARPGAARIQGTH